MPPRVVAVVVAYNRAALLAEALSALEAQTVRPAAIVVVDNASTDDSAAVARAHPSRPDVLSLARNTGGAGGFAVGIARALELHEPDWVWLMDDDTIPTPTALEALLDATDGDAVVVGSRVVWTDGSDHPMNTPRPNPFARRRERAEAAARGLVPVRSSSFVSLLASARAVRDKGLPIADYFIWNDDFEYSTRLIRGARGFYQPASVVVHKTAKLGSTDVDPGERFYYEVRNKLWMWRLSRSLGPLEKLGYGAASLARWLRTLVRSGDRRVLWSGLRRGIRDGLGGRPRPNAVALAGLGEASDAVAAVEASR